MIVHEPPRDDELEEALRSGNADWIPRLVEEIYRLRIQLYVLTVTATHQETIET